MSTNRLESFSDGVLAVAITLLVLNIAVPLPESLKLPNHPHTLGGALAENWPTYAAYVTSFLTIGIIWINHHAMIGRLRAADHAILMLNLLLLMSVAVIPFATSLLAEYLARGQGDNLAAGVYGGVLLCMALAFVVLNHHILFRKPHLLSPELSAERRRQILTRMLTGLIPYVIATAAAAVSAYATLIITAALAVFYALPIAAGIESSK